MKTSALIYASLILCLVASTAHTAPPTEQSANKIYSVSTKIDDTKWTVQWSSIHIAAQSEDDKHKTLFAIAGHHEDEECESSKSVQLLSLVGPYAAYKFSSGGYCQGTAHPWAYVGLHAVDIRDGKKISLITLFSEEILFRALMQDSYIRKALKGAKPTSLKALWKMVDGGCRASIDDSALTSFAFHHIKGDQIAIRIGFSHGCEAARGAHTQIAFYLPIPEKLAGALKTANKNKLLMKDLAKLKY